MRNSTNTWIVVIIAIAILCVFIDLPGDNRFLFTRPIVVRPGLDIQGGVRVLLAVQSDQPVNSDQMSQVRQVIDKRVNALGVSEPLVQIAGANRVIVELPGISDRKAAIDLIQQTALLEFVDFSKTGACTAAMPSQGQYILTDRQFKLRGGAAFGGAAATQAATLSATSVATAETVITTAGTPGATATNVPLFKMIQVTQAATAAPTATSVPVTTQAATVAATSAVTAVPTAGATSAATLAATSSSTPAPVAGTKSNPLSNPCTNQPFTTIMTGDGLSTANAQLSGTASSQWVINFTLKGGDASKGFVDYTARAAANHDPLAIVLDGEVLSSPQVNAALTDGGIIQGSFTQQSATNLAVQLRSGALPVSLTIESTEQVGASLGTQSVNSSIRAGLLGVLIVLLFVLIYYRIPGIAAALALLLFAAMNFALYKFLPVTLTLSAITGFLISIGTAVDGNILIFERIKEELRAGRPLTKAIDTGFNRAWPSIRDSNISTIIIGFILYFFGGQFGASTVRGFAVTLILGLVTNLFTAVIVTHTFLNIIVALGGDRIRQMKIFGGE